MRVRSAARRMIGGCVAATALLLGPLAPTSLAESPPRIIVYVVRHVGNKDASDQYYELVNGTIAQMALDISSQLSARRDPRAADEKARAEKLRAYHLYPEGRSLDGTQARAHLQERLDGLQLLFGQVCCKDTEQAQSLVFLGELYGNMPVKFIGLNSPRSGARQRWAELKFVTAYALAMDAEKRGVSDIARFYLGYALVYAADIKPTDDTPKELTELLGVAKALQQRWAAKP